MENTSTPLSNINPETGRSKAFELVYKLLPEKDKAYFEKVVDRADTDPQRKVGKVCGYGYSKCKWCSASIQYEKKYQSRIQDIQIMVCTDPLVGYLGAFGLSVMLLSSSFSSGELSAESISKELDKIRNNDIYDCSGSPSSDFCSEKCQFEYSIYH